MLCIGCFLLLVLRGAWLVFISSGVILLLHPFLQFHRQFGFLLTIFLHIRQIIHLERIFLDVI